MSHRQRMARMLTALLIAAPTTAAILSIEPAAASSDRTIIRIPKESQPVPRRPTLESIKRSTAQQNMTLAEGIDAYVARVVATDSRATARAKEDGADPATEPEIKIDDLWLSELTDLKPVIRDRGISLEEAIERIAWQPRLNEIGAALEQRYPGELSGLAVLDDGLGAQIGFKGKIPDYAIELARTLPVAVELVGNKGFSQTDLKQARDAAYADIAAKQRASEVLMGSYDTDSGVVKIVVRARVNPDDRAGQRALLDQLQPAQPANDKIRVDVSLGDKDLFIPEDNYMRGGGEISGCTTAFNIINGNFPSDPNARMTTTAAHCGTGGSKTYCNHPTQGGCISSNFGRSSTTYDIAAWTRGSFTLTRTFYFDYNKPRYVYYVGTNPAKGQNICNYGHARQYAACANIKAIDVDYRNAAGAIVMDRDIAVSGDSGGPWYKSNTAWGIHIGDCAHEVTITSCFTPATLISSALNRTGESWSVWTAPPGT